MRLLLWRIPHGNAVALRRLRKMLLRKMRAKTRHMRVRGRSDLFRLTNQMFDVSSPYGEKLLRTALTIKSLVILNEVKNPNFNARSANTLRTRFFAHARNDTIKEIISLVLRSKPQAYSERGRSPKWRISTIDKKQSYIFPTQWHGNSFLFALYFFCFFVHKIMPHKTHLCRIIRVYFICKRQTQTHIAVNIPE